MCITYTYAHMYATSCMNMYVFRNTLILTKQFWRKSGSMCLSILKVNLLIDSMFINIKIL